MTSYLNAYEGVPIADSDFQELEIEQQPHTPLQTAQEVLIRAKKQLRYLRRSNPRLTFFGFGISILVVGWSLLSLFNQSPLRYVKLHLYGNDEEVWNLRAEAVKSAFIDAYHAYEAFAFPHDELRPLMNGRVDNFNGWGVSAIDSLDTMLLMGAREEFDRALRLVGLLDFAETDLMIPFFETTIRYLGGLLSAYALSGEKILLAKADELAEALLPVFNTKSGFPIYAINPVQGKMRHRDAYLAEIASCQMEFKYLAHVTGKQQYSDLVDKINKNLYNANVSSTDGLLPQKFDLNTGDTLDYTVSMGAMGDSGHEYLLKQYLLTSHNNNELLEMYIRTATKAIEHLLYLSPKEETLYITQVTMTPRFTADNVSMGSNHRPDRFFQHLACFFPGLLALGVHLLPSDILSTDEKFKQLTAAEGLAQACFKTYADQPSGLGPDYVKFDGPFEIAETTDDVLSIDDFEKMYRWLPKYEDWVRKGRIGNAPGIHPVEIEDGSSWWRKFSKWRRKRKDPRRDYQTANKAYLLRPETVESFYILWRVTGDEIWRAYGWEVFKAIEQSAKVRVRSHAKGRDAYAYASVADVTKDRKWNTNTWLKDEMPSYFLAETLKYLYLLFISDDPVPLNAWVFNTEAHPLPVFEEQWRS